MAQLRVALAQVDTTVGDLAGNASLVRQWTKQAAAEGAHVVAFPEMTLTGYPAEDLVLRGSFVEAALQRPRAARRRPRRRRAAATLPSSSATSTARPHAPAAAGPAAARAAERRRAPPRRAGRPALRPSTTCPTTACSTRRATSSPATCCRCSGCTASTSRSCICEDLWQDGGPIAVAAAARAGLVLCINASPYEQGKTGCRTELAARRAREAGAALAYVNQVGGQDELVFDGGSLVVDADGAAARPHHAVRADTAGRPTSTCRVGLATSTGRSTRSTARR